MPIDAGLPICTGAPCTAGKRVVIWMARMASAGFIGRMDTTMGPWNGPAGVVAIEVRYIGTVRPQADVAQLDAVLDQRLLEGERAAQHEGDEIVAPMGADVGRLVDDLAAAEYPVA